MSFDITDTLAPKSDQLDAVDLLGGPRVFTIKGVSKGTPDQPVQVALQEFPRPWRPGKSMRRVLAAAWGPDASKWVGRRVRLWCDPSVVFAGQEVGGVRIQALSHIDKPKKIPLLVTRGKSATYTVEPLHDDPAPTVDELAEMKRTLWQLAKDANPDADQQQVMGWLTEQATTYGKSLDVLDDVRDLVGILSGAEADQ